MRDHDTNRDSAAQQARTPYETQEAGALIHRVCVTCNNMFETDVDHIDAKYCAVCRRA